MDKIFLSHSSKNKDYVRPIFEYFGGDRCVFDEEIYHAQENLNNDNKKLSQIFPIIIDDSITYADKRIPD